MAARRPRADGPHGYARTPARRRRVWPARSGPRQRVCALTCPCAFTLAAAADWVRDVAWAPNFGLPMNTLASAGQDGKVFIWTERQEGELRVGALEGCCGRRWQPPPAMPGTLPTPAADRAGGWERHLLHDFGAPVWRVSWSVSGNILSVADGSNAVTLWKEAADGQWQQITQ